MMQQPVLARAQQVYGIVGRRIIVPIHGAVIADSERPVIVGPAKDFPNAVMVQQEVQEGHGPNHST